MTIELNEAERDQMAHAIGHHSAKGCSVKGGRNYYVTDAADPLWLGLVDRGLATKRANSILPTTEAVFHLTDQGRAAVEADPRSKRVGRSFTVRMRGRDYESQVWASTHGKARYQVAREVAYIWNVGVLEAFKLIESCRLS